MIWRTAWMVAALALGSALAPRQRRWVWAGAAGAIDPTLAVLGLGGIAVAQGLRRRRQRHAARRRARQELPLLGELVGLGLTGGKSFGAAVAAAIPHLSEPLASEVAAVVRRGRLHGSALVLETHAGVAHRLYQLAGRAIATGAPLAGAIEAFADEARTADRAERLAATRRLPVLLMFPLALLILPGFVLLTVAPAVVGAIERLGP